MYHVYAVECCSIKIIINYNLYSCKQSKFTFAMALLQHGVKKVTISYF